MTEHRASCQCGGLHITASNDPDFVIACNCRACQKRTGSPFGAGAYFQRSTLTISGVHKEWVRSSDAARSIDNHFCPDCGSTVFWGIEKRPDHIGVAFGAFDTTPPRPNRVVWAEEQHDWVSFPDSWEIFEKGSVPG
ncbi:MAG: GFA family protein [Paracoccaceae bacterium]